MSKVDTTEAKRPVPRIDVTPNTYPSDFNHHYKFDVVTANADIGSRVTTIGRIKVDSGAYLLPDDSLEAEIEYFQAGDVFFHSGYWSELPNKGQVDAAFNSLSPEKVLSSSLPAYLCRVAAERSEAALALTDVSADTPVFLLEDGEWVQLDHTVEV